MLFRSLTEAANYLSAKLSGRTLDAARGEILKEIEEQRAELDALTARIVAEGIAFHEAQPPIGPPPGLRKPKGRRKRRTGHNLLLRLQGRRQDVLRFATDLDVPNTWRLTAPTPVFFHFPSPLDRYAGEANGDWKLLVWDEGANAPRLPKGQVGYRWGEEKGKWNLLMEDGVDSTKIDPALSFLERHDGVASVSFDEFVTGQTLVNSSAMCSMTNWL